MLAMKRSRTGCSLCKLRKVRCDERVQGGCGNCERLKVKCPGRSDSASTAGYVRVKVAGACTTCRAMKLRCSRGRPTCASCQKRRVACKYDEPAPSKEARAGPTSATHGRDEESQSEAADVLFESRELMQELVGAFFRHIAPVRCLAFVDHALLLEAIDKGDWKSDYGEAFMLAICALGLRHSPMTDSTQSRSESWISLSQTLALQSISLPTFMTLASLTLLVEHHLHSGSRAAAFMLTALCSRMTHLLLLEDPGTASTQGSLETEAPVVMIQRTRLLWACRIHDIIISAGIESFELSRQPPQIALHIDASSAECALAPNAIEADAHSTLESSLTALSAQLFEIRHAILKLIREFPHDLQPWDGSSNMMQALAELDRWEESLPLHLRYLDGREPTDSATGPLFNLHLYYHQCRCDLLRVSLPGYKFPVSRDFDKCPMNLIHSWQTSCMFHAGKVADLLHTCAGSIGLDNLLLPTFAYESSKILAVIHAICLKEESESERNMAVQRINSNLTYINAAQASLADAHRIPESLILFLDKLGYQDVTMRWQLPYLKAYQLDDDIGYSQQMIIHPMTTLASARHELESAKKRKVDPSKTSVNAASSLAVVSSGSERGMAPTDSEDSSSVQSTQPGSQSTALLLTSEIEDFLMLDPDLVALSNEWA